MYKPKETTPISYIVRVLDDELISIKASISIRLTASKFIPYILRTEPDLGTPTGDHKSQEYVYNPDLKDHLHIREFFIMMSHVHSKPSRIDISLVVISFRLLKDTTSCMLKNRIYRNNINKLAKS